MHNIWTNGILGLVVGDALGVPVQFLDRDMIRNREEGPVTGMESGGVYDMPEGTWSDDSSMALATLSSMINLGQIDPSDIMTQFVLWRRRGDYTPFGKSFDEGITCTEAICRYTKDGDYRTCGQTGEYANGNGALMRIMPVCLFYCDRDKGNFSDEEAVHGIHTVAALTHNHLRSNICCGMYYFLVKGIIHQSGSDMIDTLQKGIDSALDFYRRDTSNLTELSYLGRLFDLHELHGVSETEIKTTGYVIDSFEAAVWCLITTDSYRECMLKAVNLGDDTDTVAAIAGGLAGLFYGYDAIPEEWLAVIKRREWIMDLCRQA